MKFTIDIKTKIIAVLLATFVIFGVIFFKWSSNTIKEKDRLKSNVKALTINYNFWKTKSGDQAVTIQALQLKKKETSEEVKNDIKDMNISDPSSYASIGIGTEFSVPAKYHDTMYIVKAETIDTIKTKCFDYVDEFTEIHTCIDQDFYMFHKDSIKIGVDPIYKHSILWGLIKWKKIGANITIKNECPYSTILYSKYIEFR